jgi:indolepyruvate ferredoxin oxidoreductase
LQDAVARNYFALLAYKDEYEVARLHTQTEFLETVRRNFGSRARPTFHFSPPLFAATDPSTGRPKKYEFGPWILPVLRVIAKLRGLRGTRLDPFRYSADRLLERQMLARYERLVERLIAEVDERRFEVALELARLPADVRGYGPIKRAAAERAAQRQARLLEAWEAPPACVEQPASASVASKGFAAGSVARRSID